MKARTIWMLINSLAIICIVILLLVRQKHKSYAFVSNQQIFANFEGRKDLNEKFEFLKNQHKEILDSLYSEAKSQSTGEKMNELQALSQKFMAQETEISERYMNQAWTQINTYLNEFGHEHGYDLILGANGQGALMFADSSLNVTEEAILFLNSKYHDEKEEK